MLFQFIWQNKPEKVKRELLLQDYKNGGIKMPDIQNVITSLKSSWIKRRYLNNNKWGILFQSTTGVSTRDLTIYGDYSIASKIDSIQNKFWKDVLLSWVTIQHNQMLLTTEDIIGQNIWYNSKIPKDRKPFLYSNYMKQGIIFIYDLLDNEGNILTFETFRNKYQIK